MERLGWCRTLAGVAAFALASTVGPVRADVSPGDRITDQNIDKVKDLVSPGMEWVLKHGWPMSIVGPQATQPRGNRRGRSDPQDRVSESIARA